MCSARVAQAWLMGLTAEAKQAGGPPVSGRLPQDSMDPYWPLWLCHLPDHSQVPRGCCWQLVLTLLIFSGGRVRHRFPVKAQMPRAHWANEALICVLEQQARHGSFLRSLMFQSIMKNEWLFPAALLLLCTLAQEIYDFLRRRGG